jgi:hypothetical protein
MVNDSLDDPVNKPPAQETSVELTVPIQLPGLSAETLVEPAGSWTRRLVVPPAHSFAIVSETSVRPADVALATP